MQGKEYKDTEWINSCSFLKSGGMGVIWWLSLSCLKLKGRNFYFIPFINVLIMYNLEQLIDTLSVVFLSFDIHWMKPEIVLVLLMLVWKLVRDCFCDKLTHESSKMPLTYVVECAASFVPHLRTQNFATLLFILNSTLLRSWITSSGRV
jgi:hypothetical protein